MDTTATSPSRHPLLARLASGALGEPVMGFFAIVALALAGAPFAIDLSPAEDRFLDGCEWAIVGLFALEYVVSLAVAEDRVAYARSLWRLLDLVIILAPLVTILAPESDTLRATPVLRLVRVALFSARLSGLVTRQAARKVASQERGPARVSILRAGDEPRPTTWAAVSEALKLPPADDWFHASGLDREHVLEIAREAGISPTFLSQTLAETAYPRVEVYERFSALFLWLPALTSFEDAHVDRNGVLVLATDHGLLTIAQRPVDLQEQVLAQADELTLPAGPFVTRTALALLKLVLRRYEEVAGHLEHHARALELVPVRESRPEFLERTFRLQRQVAAIKSDLWRLKGIFAALAEGRLPFHGLPRAPEAAGDEPGAERAAAELVRLLADEASYIYETAFNAREGLLALIDLHLNVVSFEMNKVMRVLAVVSVLGLVPTVVGGLLGMNLIGNPWPITLSHVAYTVTAAMGLLVYVFFVKGWLR